MSDIKKESSVVANVSGFQQGGEVLRKKKKNNPSKPFEKSSPKAFESVVAQSVLTDKEISEVVRARGDSWVIFDDETGAEVQTFSDREDAWKKQRQMRKSKSLRTKASSDERKRQQRASRKPASQEKNLPPPAPKPHKSESIFRDLLNPLHESMISYVFEQGPLDGQYMVWEDFMNKVPREVVMSDPKMSKILRNIAKTEAKLLGKAIQVVERNIKLRGFQLERRGVEQDPETGEILVGFGIMLPESRSNLKFSVKLQNGKPTISIPEHTKIVLNSLGNDESKLLRAELMHVQETVLDEMDDVLREMQRRDGYLGKLHKKFENVCNALSPFETMMFRHLLKNKQKGRK